MTYSRSAFSNSFGFNDGRRDDVHENYLNDSHDEHDDSRDDHGDSHGHDDCRETQYVHEALHVFVDHDETALQSATQAS